MNNLYLIGIMGCGKTSAGKRAAKILKAPFFDVDREVEKKEGMPIRDIFKRSGQDAFREMESQVLFQLSDGVDAVISTGGGIILDQKNVDKMKKSGTIIWIRRPVDTILKQVNTEVRPLLQKDPQRLIRIYEEREPLYRNAADIIIDNKKSLKEAAEKIVQAYVQRDKTKKN